MANSSDWGLTELGFRRPSYAEILDAVEYKAKEIFTKDGKTPNLTVRSPLGMIFRLLAWLMSLLFQLQEDIYNSRFVDTAVGNSLFQLGRAIGLSVLPAQRSSGYLEVSGPPGIIVPAGWLVGTVAGIQFAVTSSGTIPDTGTAIIPAQCTEMGEIGNVGENTITQVITPLEVTLEVTNASAFDGGRGKETSEQFRDRYRRSVDFAGGVNADAIQAEILQNVEGVLAAKVYENKSDYEDHRGLPPHSIESVVFAGLDYEVAKAIYRRGAAGIETHGSTMVEINSPQNGQTYEIRFTRPSPVSVWMKITDLQVDEDLFPANGLEQLQQALVNYVGSDITGGLNIGEHVIYNKLPCRLYSVPGVIDFTLEISPDGATYSKNNIQIGERQKAVTDAGKILIASVSVAEGAVTP